MRHSCCSRASLLALTALFFLDALARGAEPQAPTVTTRPATALGLSAMTVNGSIHPHGRPTTYYFEYGPTAAYGSKTAAVPLPPRLAAYYRETWDENLGGWGTWLKPTHFPTGGAVNGFVRFAEPSRDDHNHDNGIGTVHLTKYLYPGPLTGTPSVYLGGGDPDFRDAKIAVWVRGNNWKPNGSELLWWTQSQSNIEKDNTGWLRANWAYTGFNLTDYLMDGKWHKVEYRLLNDTSNWTYTGGTGGYVYWSIDRAQAHLNTDFFHMEAFIDVKNPPTGSIDFDEFEVAYRNYSLLLPSNGGKLATAPASDDDPARLTDGWRHGKGHTWRSAENPAGPLEFVYAFADPVTIHTVQLHQNPDWPARDVEVLTSADGKTFTDLTKLTLLEKGKPNANSAFAIKRGLSAKARQLKVRIISGYRAKHWGLGEIEVFGTGATMLPDDDLYYVNIDIENLKPGMLYHYRLVATSSQGTRHGEDRTFTTPATNQPIAETGQASRITTSAAKVEGRMTALGQAARFYFEYGPGKEYGSKTVPADGGLQITPRTVFANLDGLKPATVYHFRLVAVNKGGTTYGGDGMFTTAAGQ